MYVRIKGRKLGKAERRQIKEVKMTEPEFIEKLEAILEAGDIVLNPPDDLAEFINKETLKKLRVAQILALIREAGYVKLAKDQHLPQAPVTLIDKMVKQRLTRSPYSLAQQDMLKAGWRKIEL